MRDTSAVCVDIAYRRCRCLPHSPPLHRRHPLLHPAGGLCPERAAASAAAEAAAACCQPMPLCSHSCCCPRPLLLLLLPQVLCELSWVPRLGCCWPPCPCPLSLQCVVAAWPSAAGAAGRRPQPPAPRWGAGLRCRRPGGCAAAAASPVGGCLAMRWAPHLWAWHRAWHPWDACLAAAA